MHLGRLLMSTPSGEESLMIEGLESLSADEVFEGNASEPTSLSTGVNMHPHIDVDVPGSSTNA